MQHVAIMSWHAHMYHTAKPYLLAGREKRHLKTHRKCKDSGVFPSSFPEETHANLKPWIWMKVRPAGMARRSATTGHHRPHTETDAPTDSRCQLGASPEASGESHMRGSVGQGRRRNTARALSAHRNTDAPHNAGRLKRHITLPRNNGRGDNNAQLSGGHSQVTAANPTACQAVAMLKWPY